MVAVSTLPASDGLYIYTDHGGLGAARCGFAGRWRVPDASRGRSRARAALMRPMVHPPAKPPRASDTLASRAMIALRAALLLALPSLLSARWCQVENVKADVEGDYTFAGPWRVDTCTTLLLDHGKCDEDECPHRKQFEDEEIIELADALHGNTVLTALDLGSNKLTDESVKALAEALRDNEALIDLSLRDNQIGGAPPLPLPQRAHHARPPA